MLKKSTSKQQPSNREALYTDVHKLGQDLVVEMKDLKKKYDQMDSGNKKKLIAGIAGVAALLMGAKAIKKMAKKKKAEKQAKKK
ncbi:MAG: hypothetical protein A2445_03675 [Candidatus Jacksonbacteria bacterium RIFOXYC2_FULL_44_29]|nr:MAG: hypothetical protein UV19_C0009G0011 [Parcubacteria group bacterium GW2011_GWA2_42_28]KKT53972.1 MAG: hypothetical protein UW45_C0021G0011 [Parcubacteria group bacterium GW2011_GWC2_44_22]OGY75552.1 MAG: hypothetical protein A2295_02490 [Candidatus Jacksonbacteria bacterium RIFOXYB2_FULL_44_15]OGY75855.1 MAG: hypothetical protein A2240_01570 [Candidatus Jacksonbacteria bacterium RIFOXYA2_FULL_43_12]OGY77202.1 MAG: hypothetical protein A2445_03675 [Candidatus Jacksonbacteria bacterium RI